MKTYTMMMNTYEEPIKKVYGNDFKKDDRMVIADMNSPENIKENNGYSKPPEARWFLLDKKSGLLIGFADTEHKLEFVYDKNIKYYEKFITTQVYQRVCYKKQKLEEGEKLKWEK